MALYYEVLGKISEDNTLAVQIDTGQKIHNLLFDCGNCISTRSFGDLLNTDFLFFSHFHMDHIAGFDSYFRALFNRENKQNVIYGPPESADILQHRFQAYAWNLCTDYQVSWFVKEIHQDKIITYRFELNEAFQIKYFVSEEEIENNVILATKEFQIQAHSLNHQIPSIAYVVQESDKQNIDTQKVKQMDLPVGAWLQQVKNSTLSEVEIQGKIYALEELRKKVLQTNKGQNITYLTDFLWDEPTKELMKQVLKEKDTVICEAQYLHEDLELAIKNFHTTVVQSAEIMKEANIKQLILFHVSPRYSEEQCIELLEEAREIFPQTDFPKGWSL